MRAIVILFLLCSGCSTIRMGRDYDPRLLDKMREAKASRAEVMKAMGAPWFQFTNPDGTESWTYMYSVTNSHVDPASLIIPFYTGVNLDQKTKTTTVIFKDDKMTNWESAWGNKLKNANQPVQGMP